MLEGLDGIQPGQEIWILTWLTNRGRAQDPEMGVFATRSPDGPTRYRTASRQVLSIDEKCSMEVLAL